MTEVRESIALKVQAGGPVSLTGEEAVDVLRMIHELGKLEAAAIDHQRIVGGLRAQVAERDIALENAREVMARDRRSLWDSYASAGLAAGKDVDTAASQADQMLIRREGRRA